MYNHVIQHSSTNVVPLILQKYYVPFHVNKNRNSSNFKRYLCSVLIDSDKNTFNAKK